MTEAVPEAYLPEYDIEEEENPEVRLGLPQTVLISPPVGGCRLLRLSACLGGDRCLRTPFLAEPQQACVLPCRCAWDGTRATTWCCVTLSSTRTTATTSGTETVAQCVRARVHAARGSSGVQQLGPSPGPVLCRAWLLHAAAQHVMHVECVVCCGCGCTAAAPDSTCIYLGHAFGF